MKGVYPVIFKKDGKFIVTYSPDFNINSQGKDFYEAIEMIRDAIGMMGVALEDEEREIPKGSEFEKVREEYKNETILLVDVDFVLYRRKKENKYVRRNCTLPAWLDREASNAGINVSAVLQSALKEKLNVN